mgnify:CR=1 FL=1
MSLRQPPQDKFRDLEKVWKRADRATLEHTELAECILACARKRLERLEVKKCLGPRQMSLPITKD